MLWHFWSLWILAQNSDTSISSTQTVWTCWMLTQCILLILEALILISLLWIYLCKCNHLTTWLLFVCLFVFWHFSIILASFSSKRIIIIATYQYKRLIIVVTSVLFFHQIRSYFVFNKLFKALLNLLISISVFFFIYSFDTRTHQEKLFKSW